MRLITVNLSLCLTKLYVMKTYGEWRYTSTFSWPRHRSASSCCQSNPGEGALLATHWIGGRVDLREGLDDVKIWKLLALPGLLEFRPHSRPSNSQPLYRLRYRGSMRLTASFNISRLWIRWNTVDHVLLVKEVSRKQWILFPSSGGTYSVGPNRKS
jgi:hypothetical protein